MVGPCRAPNLNQEFLQRRPVECEIPRALVAYRAYRPQIRWIVTASHGFVDDVPDVEPRLSGGVGGVRFTGDGTAHLAREAVAVEYECPSLFRDAPLKCRDRFRVEKKVLAWLEVAPVIVRQDLVPLLSPEFTDAPSPFACVSRSLAQLI